MKNIFFKSLLSALVVFGFISCESDEYYYYNYPDTAYGTITNASPNSGGLDFFSDENQINSSPLDYTNTFGYYNFYTGNRIFTVKNNQGDVLAQTEINLRAGDHFSVFAVNTFDNIELVSYSDLLRYPALNNAVVRFINLSPDSGDVNVKSETRGFAEGLSFKESTGFVEVSSGFYNFSFTKSDTGESLYKDMDVELRPGRIYTIYTKGFAAPPAGSNDTFSTKIIRNY